MDAGVVRMEDMENILNGEARFAAYIRYVEWGRDFIKYSFQYASDSVKNYFLLCLDLGNYPAGSNEARNAKLLQEVLMSFHERVELSCASTYLLNMYNGGMWDVCHRRGFMLLNYLTLLEGALTAAVEFNEKCAEYRYDFGLEKLAMIVLKDLAQRIPRWSDEVQLQIVRLVRCLAVRYRSFALAAVLDGFRYPYLCRRTHEGFLEVLEVLMKSSNWVIVAKAELARKKHGLH